MRREQNHMRWDLITGTIILLLFAVVGAYMYMGAHNLPSAVGGEENMAKGSTTTASNILPSLQSMCMGLEGNIKNICESAAEKLSPIISSKYPDYEVSGIRIGHYEGEEVAGFYLKKPEENAPSKLVFIVIKTGEIKEVELNK